MDALIQCTTAARRERRAGMHRMIRLTPKLAARVAAPSAATSADSAAGASFLQARERIVVDGGQGRFEARARPAWSRPSAR